MSDRAIRDLGSSEFTDTVGPVTRRIAQFIGSLCEKRRRSAATLVICFVLAAATAWYGAGIKIDTDLNNESGSPMPQDDQGSVTADDAAMILTWITEGAPEN